MTSAQKMIATKSGTLLLLKTSAAAIEGYSMRPEGTPFHPAQTRRPIPSA